MARGTRGRLSVWLWIFCGLLFVVRSPARAGEIRRDDERGLAFYEFAGDLIHPWSEVAPYPSTFYGGDYVYQPAEALPKTVREQIAAVVPGLTRMGLEDMGWGENGGPAFAEFLCSTPLRSDGPIARRTRYAVRVALRPAAMSAQVYADAAQRRAWLREHRPRSDPQDVVMSVSRPYLALSITD